MAKNMCYENSAQAIHDILHYENGIDLDDVITATIGLSNIVADLQVEDKKKELRISKLEKRIRELKRGI